MSRMNSYRASVIANRMEQNSCLGKREHFSLREAQDAAETVGRRIGELVPAYECPFCRLFHVGHRKSQKRIEAERKLKKYGFEVGRVHEQ